MATVIFDENTEVIVDFFDEPCEVKGLTLGLVISDCDDTDQASAQKNIKSIKEKHQKAKEEKESKDTQKIIAALTARVEKLEGKAF